jgi:hypothetical protein
MTATVDRAWLARHHRAVVLAAVVVVAELGLVASYVAVGASRVTDWAIVVLPWVWINVGVWAIVRTRPPAGSPRRRRLAAVVAIGYFGVLAFVGGLAGPGVASQPASFRVALTSIPPGWAPTVLANTAFVRLSVVPYQLVGYLALAYLVYATTLDAAGSAITGLVGLLSCVSCTWPVVASVLTGVVGGGAALSLAASSQSYLVSTGVFLVTVALLYWRPGFSSVPTG